MFHSETLASASRIRSIVFSTGSLTETSSPMFRAMAFTLAGFIGVPPLSMALMRFDACWYSSGSFLPRPRSRVSQIKYLVRFLVAIVVYVIAKILLAYDTLTKRILNRLKPTSPNFEERRVVCRQFVITSWRLI